MKIFGFTITKGDTQKEIEFLRQTARDNYNRIYDLEEEAQRKKEECDYYKALYNTNKDNYSALREQYDKVADELAMLKKEASACVQEVDHPKHYQGKMECIDAMIDAFGPARAASFCLLNAFKYEYRKGSKPGQGVNGSKDTEKRNWYITKHNELESSRMGNRIYTKEEIENLVRKYKQ